MPKPKAPVWGRYDSMAATALRHGRRWIAGYQHVSSEEYGARNQHSLEFGADWEIGEDRMIGFQTAFGIDGDDNGSDFEARISYIVELDMD